MLPDEQTHRVLACRRTAPQPCHLSLYHPNTLAIRKLTTICSQVKDLSLQAQVQTGGLGHRNVCSVREHDGGAWQPQDVARQLAHPPRCRNQQALTHRCHVLSHAQFTAQHGRHSITLPLALHQHHTASSFVHINMNTRRQHHVHQPQLYARMHQLCNRIECISVHLPPYPTTCFAYQLYYRPDQTLIVGHGGAHKVELPSQGLMLLQVVGQLVCQQLAKGLAAQLVLSIAKHNPQRLQLPAQ